MNSLAATFYSAGKAVTAPILGLDVIAEVNRIPYAQVVIGEGGTGSATPVELSDTACFKPGSEVELKLANHTANFSFKGIVIKQQLKKTGDNTYLTIDLKDSAHKLSLLRQSTVFANKDDAAIITEVAKRANLSVECGSTALKKLKHQQMVQYYCTNWDFIVARAEANGLLVCVENGKLHLIEPKISGSSIQLSQIQEYEIEADVSSQYQEVAGICWDVKNQTTLKALNNNQISLNGSHSFGEFSNKTGTKQWVRVSGIPGETAEMTAWANAGMVKNRHSLIRGRISIQGNPEPKLGQVITISGAGSLFGATAIVSGIRHRIDREGWTTDLQCGISSKGFYQKDDLIEKPAAGLVPGINGLQIGVVQAYPSDGDPEKLYRVKVRIPAFDQLDAKTSVVWARLNQTAAGDQRGLFWVPEAGDEVIVGFFNDDPRHPVVLGSLYNGKTTPPLDVTEKNLQKGLITKNGIKLLFCDEKDKEKLTIATPGGNTILLEDEKGITVEDKNKNKITLHDQGVAFADKNQNQITTNDKGTIVEDANKNKLTLSKQGIEIKDANGNSMALSSAGIQLKDMNGNKVVLEASGITVQSAANVTVKGAIINLN